jgi:hypothetical protein
MIDLALVPISPVQLSAATVIHDHHMPGWDAAEEALDRMGVFLPGWDADSILAKAAVLNQLYNARHDRLLEATSVICQTMADPPDDPIALVDIIAPVDHDGEIWDCVSFASKFVHFFIAPDLAPVYDGWAVDGLRHHFGRLKWANKTTYRAYADYVYVLRDSCGPSCSLREFDRYLWLSAQYRQWLRAEKRETVGVSGEVRRVFESEEPKVKETLRTLLGDVL